MSAPGRPNGEYRGAQDEGTPRTVPPAFATAHLRHVPRRYYGRWTAAAVILLAFAVLIQAFAAGQIEWKVVGQFFTAKAILIGLENTIIMTICAMALGIALGVLFAVMYMSPIRC